MHESINPSIYLPLSTPVIAMNNRWAVNVDKIFSMVHAWVHVPTVKRLSLHIRKNDGNR